MRAMPAFFDQTLPWGIALLRVVVGLVFFMHGQQKLVQMGFGGVTGMLGSLGVPAAGLAAIVVIALETIGALALTVGLLTRVFGILFAIDMAAALLLVHRPNGFFVNNGGFEFVLVLGTAALALALTGPGALALDTVLPVERRQPARGRSELAPGRS